MEMQPALTYTIVTIRPTNMRMVVSANCSADQARKSSCEHGKEMLVLSGENSKMTAAKKESTARCSATSQPTLVQNLYVKRMRLLMRSGLVKGTIPTSKRKGSAQLTLDAVLKWPVGNDAE